MLPRQLSLSLTAFCLFVLYGCSSGSGDSSPSFSAAEPALSYSSTKRFDFTWADSEGAEFYRVLENKDSSSGFIQVGNDIPAGTQSFSLSAPLFSRLNASYILQSCDSSVCVDSSEVFVSGNLADAIGYLKANNPDSGDYFGSSVSLSADASTLAIGAWGEDSSTVGIADSDVGTDDDSSNSGAVYVFTLENFQWSLQGFIKASNAEASDWFGYSVSLSNDGNTLVVGAINESSSATGVNGNQSDNNASDSGAAYVFTRSSDSWSQSAYLKASNTGQDDSFGKAVTISGDGSTIAIGAEEERSNASGINGDQTNNSWSNAGAVYVFAKSASSWQQQAYVKASNTLPISTKYFGESVSLSDDGNTLAVGASGDNSSATGINGNESDTNASRSGAAYIFKRENSAWTQQAYIKASNTEEEDSFGYKVTLSGDGETLAVSASFEDGASTGINGNQSDNSEFRAGAVYAFQFSNNQWSQTAYIKASNTGSSDEFGSGISLNTDGSILAIGAAAEDGSEPGINGDEQLNEEGNSGAVYVFERINDSWSQLSYLKSTNPDSADLFGSAISISGDGKTIAVGAQLEDGNRSSVDDNSASSAGAVYLY